MPALYDMYITPDAGRHGDLPLPFEKYVYFATLPTKAKIFVKTAANNAVADAQRVIDILAKLK